MMNKNLKAFNNDVEVPEIVKAKADAALDMIRKERTEMMKNTNVSNEQRNYRDKEKTERRYLHFFKSQAAAAACVIVLAGCGITAAATGFHLWSRGMQGTIQATPEEQQKMIDQGVAIVDDGSSLDKTDSSLSKLAVTDAGITVVPDTVIVDDREAHISFSVQGYDLPDDAEPFFNSVNFYLDLESGNTELSDTKEPISGLSGGASFYDGTVPNLTEVEGVRTYDDGTPLGYDENGKIIVHYTDDQGNLEYLLSVAAPEGTSLVGQTLHVELGNLGTVGDKGEFSGDIDGNWNFSIQLPDVSSGKTIEVKKPIEGSDFVLEDVNISPISIQLDYSSSEKHEIVGDNMGMPWFTGIVMKDGSKYPYISNGGGGGYTDDTLTNAYETSGFAKVIDPDEVAAILIYPCDPGEGLVDYVEIPLEN